MVNVSKFYDKKPVLKDIYLSFFTVRRRCTRVERRVIVAARIIAGNGHKSSTARWFFKGIPSGFLSRSRSWRSKPSSRSSKKKAHRKL